MKNGLTSLLVAAGLLAGSAAQAANVCYYDMSAGQGQGYQTGPIALAGHTPVFVSAPNAGQLAGCTAFLVMNPSNGNIGGEWSANLGAITAWTQAGGSLLVYDRFAVNVGGSLPCGGGIQIVRALGANINVIDNSTLVTNGPLGVINNSNLDGGNFSFHGYASVGTLPGTSIAILSTGNPSQAVHSCYACGNGSVQYSTNPADFYYSFFGTISGTVRGVYVPNSVAYAADGACNANVNNPPVAQCQNVTVAANDQCVADANIDNGSFDPDGDPITLSQNPAGPYSLGGTSVTLTVTDDKGASAQCSATVDVVDQTAPTIDCNATATIIPPQPHPQQPVCFAWKAADNCSLASGGSVTGWRAYKINGNGKEIDTTHEQHVIVEGDRFCIKNTGGVDNVFVWGISVTDGSGNVGTASCTTTVINPGKGL